MRPLREQRVLVTGSTDGLGRELATALVGRGAWVIVHGRDPAKVQRTVSETGAAEGITADLADLDQVRALARAAGELDTLVNNAGVIVPERRESADGHELTFAINHLSHFLLTRLVKLREPARIVNVSSLGQAPIDFEDPMLERGYQAYGAYSQSKLAQILFTIELAERLNGNQITVNALHPATLMDTKMVRETFGRSSSPVAQGVDATLRLIEDPALDAVSGRFFDGDREAAAHKQAYDPEARHRLWELSERLTA